MHRLQNAIIVEDSEFNISIFNNGRVQGKVYLNNTSKIFARKIKLYFDFYLTGKNFQCISTRNFYLSPGATDSFDFAFYLPTKEIIKVQNVNIQLKENLYHKNKKIEDIFQGIFSYIDYYYQQ